MPGATRARRGARRDGRPGAVFGATRAGMIGTATSAPKPTARDAVGGRDGRAAGVRADSKALDTASLVLNYPHVLNFQH